jgi:hypothetical protein
MAEAAGSNTVQTLNGMFKEVYADKIENLIPEGTKLMQKIPFSSRKKELGSLYHQPVILGLEHGITYAGPTEDAFQLDAPISGVIRDATVQGSQMMLRSRLGIAAASRAAGGEPKAFENSTKFLVRNMLRSMARRVEVGLFYGGVGIATISNVNVNALTITTSEWAPGIWAGAEKMKIDIYSPGNVLRGTAEVASVDMDARIVNVVLTPALTAAGDSIYFKSAKDKEAVGVHKILTNTGVLFGIDAAQYNLWKGNQVAVGGPLSFALVQDAIARGVEKGLDSEVTVFVNPRTWSDLLTEQTALRQYDSSYKTSVAEAGHEEISFYGQNGKVTIVPSIFVKEGYAYVLCLDEMLRLGSTDVTFKRPDQGDTFFRELEEHAGYELRAYSDQALLCFSPGKNTLMTGIVN